MSRKWSECVQEIRARETWLTAAAERGGSEGESAEHLIATAALVHSVFEGIPVPQEAEERSRRRALAHLERLRLREARQQAVRPPWYLRFGHWMRFVFTLGRRR